MVEAVQQSMLSIAHTVNEKFPYRGGKIAQCYQLVFDLISFEVGVHGLTMFM